MEKKNYNSRITEVTNSNIDWNGGQIQLCVWDPAKKNGGQQDGSADISGCWVTLKFLFNPGTPREKQLLKTVIWSPYEHCGMWAPTLNNTQTN